MTPGAYDQERRRRRDGKRVLRKLAELSLPLDSAIDLLSNINSSGSKLYASSATGREPSGVADLSDQPSSESSVAPSAFVSSASSIHLSNPDQEEFAGPIPQALAGYRIERLLGQGGMGSVYLARQLSLNRAVALKTIRAQLASNPEYLSRFLREAISAAQLTHHNIVQVYDLSEDRGTHFFSMEFVDGKSLDTLITPNKPLPAMTAVNYVLQAARGLLFAHQHGMIHRDVKPANLLLNQQGIVKVADLGLVKTSAIEVLEGSAEVMAQSGFASGSSNTSGKSSDDDSGSQLTTIGSAIGTPAYMAPEQAEDATRVDHRADIYALGCTFYTLLTGRPPFYGKSAVEILSKHKTEPIVRPDQIVQSVPSHLSDITVRMVAKRPEDRPNSLEQVISELEKLVERGSSPAARYGLNIEALHQQFVSTRVARFRPAILYGLLGLSVLATLALLFQGSFLAAFVFLLVPAFSSVGYLALASLRQGNELLTELRRAFFLTPIQSALWLIGGVGLIGVTLAITNLWLPAIVATVIGLGVATGLAFGLDRAIEGERKAAVQGALGVVRQMRFEALDENRLRKIFAEACGKQWEEFFEQLFGYRAKRDMRKLLENEQTGPHGVKHAPWRDHLFDNLAERADRVQTRRQAKRLRVTEAARFLAEGIDPKEAQRRAAEQAAQARDHAIALRASSREYMVATAERRRALMQSLQEAKAGQRRGGAAAWMRSLKRLPNRLISGQVRLAAGIGLLLCGLAWLRHNRLLEHVKAASDQAAGGGFRQMLESLRQIAPLSTEPVPFLPEPIGPLLATMGTLVASAVMISTAWCSGFKSLASCMAGAAIAILGPAFFADYVPESVPDLGIVTAPELAAYALSLCLAAIAVWLSD